jgi:hypothetical protein
MCPDRLGPESDRLRSLHRHVTRRRHHARELPGAAQHSRIGSEREPKSVGAFEALVAVRMHCFFDRRDQTGRQLRQQRAEALYLAGQHPPDDAFDVVAIRGPRAGQHLEQDHSE